MVRSIKLLHQNERYDYVKLVLKLKFRELIHHIYLFLPPLKDTVYQPKKFYRIIHSNSRIVSKLSALVNFYEFPVD